MSANKSKNFDLFFEPPDDSDGEENSNIKGESNTLIRVGYIDDVRGYVKNLTVSEANDIARLEPGTEFIIELRSKVFYKNINEVNELNDQFIKDQLSDDFCGNAGNYSATYNMEEIEIIDEYKVNVVEDEDEDNDGNIPLVELFGGGGVGCEARAFVGNDGSILHIEVLEGGFGFEHAPIVNVRDPNGLGVGCVAQAFLNDPNEYEENKGFYLYNKKSDYEDFRILSDDTLINPEFGKVYNPNTGQEIGIWDPSKYITIESDKISDIKTLQDRLQEIDSFGNWWNTKKNDPISILRGDRKDSTYYKVSHWKWGLDEENDIKKSEVEIDFQVFGAGTQKKRSLVFTFIEQKKSEDGEWIEADDPHIFNVKGVSHRNRNKKTSIRAKNVKRNTVYKVTSNSKKKFTDSEGNKVKIDVDKVILEQGLIDGDEFGKSAKEVNKDFKGDWNKGTAIMVDVVGSTNDNDDMQLTCIQPDKGKALFKVVPNSKTNKETKNNQKKIEELKKLQTLTLEQEKELKNREETNKYNRASHDLLFQVRQNFTDKERTKSSKDSSFMNKYAISPVPKSEEPGSDYAGEVFVFEYELNFPYSGEYEFKVACDWVSRIQIDGEHFMNVNKKFAKLDGDGNANIDLNDTSNDIKHNKSSTKNVFKTKKFLVEDTSDQKNLRKTMQVFLMNSQHYEELEKASKINKPYVDVPFSVYGQGKSKYLNMNFLFESGVSLYNEQEKTSTFEPDGEHIFTISNVVESDKIEPRIYKLLPNTDYKVTALNTANNISDSTQKKQKEIVDNTNTPKIQPKALRKYEIIKVSEAEDLGYRVRENTDNMILEFDDHINNGFDLNSSFKIVSTSPNTTAKLKRKKDQDKIFLYVEGDLGDITLKFETFKDDASSKSASIAIKSLTIDDVTWEKTWTKPDSVTHTFYENKNSTFEDLNQTTDIVSPPSTEKDGKKTESFLLEQGVLESGFGKKKNKKTTEGGSKSGQYIFADFTASSNDDNDMQVYAKEGIFTPSNVKSLITELSRDEVNALNENRLDIKSDANRIPEYVYIPIIKRAAGNRKTTDISFEFTEINGNHTFTVDAPPYQQDPIPEYVSEVIDLFNNGHDGVAFSTLDYNFTFTSDEDTPHIFEIKAEDYFTTGTSGTQKKTGVEIKVKPNVKYIITTDITNHETGLVDSFGKDPEELNQQNVIGATIDGKIIFKDKIDSNNDNDDFQVRLNQGKVTSIRTVLNDVVDRHSFNLEYRYEYVNKRIVDEVEEIIQIKPGVDYSIKKKTTQTYKGKGTEQGLIDKLGDNSVEVNPEPIIGSMITGNTIFADFRASANDNDDFQIQFKKQDSGLDVIFVGENKSEVGGGANPIVTSTTKNTFVDVESNNKRSTYLLSLNVAYIKPDIEIPPKTKFGRGTWDLIYRYDDTTLNVDDGDDIEIKDIFDTSTYIDQANRKLWYLNAQVGKGKDESNFLNTYGVLPFSPKKKVYKNAKKQNVIEPEVVLESTSRPDPKVSFYTQDQKMYLKISGEGRVKVGFNLEVDDESSSGYVLTEVSIKNDGDILRLLRSEKSAGFIEKENINGIAEFTCGKSYSIKRIGGSSGSGFEFESVDKTIIFDDNVSNGFDVNSRLSVTSISYIDDDIVYNSNLSDIEKFTSIGISEDFSGTHTIIWKNIKFPADGWYNIEMMVDDSAVVYIGKHSDVDNSLFTDARERIESYENIPEEILIEKDGFDGERSTGKSIYRKKIKKGNYTIRVDLVQQPGKPIYNGNPMAIALKITTHVSSKMILSNKSWYENPLGIAIQIKAPLPTSPKEELPKVIGRCPDNPIWTTRDTQSFVPDESGIGDISVGESLSKLKINKKTYEQWWPVVDPRDSLSDRKIEKLEKKVEEARKRKKELNDKIDKFKSRIKDSKGNIRDLKETKDDLQNTISNRLSDDQIYDILYSKLSRSDDLDEVTAKIITKATVKLEEGNRPKYERLINKAFSLGPLQEKYFNDAEALLNSTKDNIQIEKISKKENRSKLDEVNKKLDILKDEIGKYKTKRNDYKSSTNSLNWSDFMNRFAISPVPPLSTINSDGSLDRDSNIEFEVWKKNGDKWIWDDNFVGANVEEDYTATWDLGEIFKRADPDYPYPDGKDDNYFNPNNVNAWYGLKIVADDYATVRIDDRIVLTNINEHQEEFENDEYSINLYEEYWKLENKINNLESKKDDLTAFNIGDDDMKKYNLNDKQIEVDKDGDGIVDLIKIVTNKKVRLSDKYLNKDELFKGWKDGKLYTIGNKLTKVKEKIKKIKTKFENKGINDILGNNYTTLISDTDWDTHYSLQTTSIDESETPLQGVKISPRKSFKLKSASTKDPKTLLLNLTGNENRLSITLQNKLSLYKEKKEVEIFNTTDWIEKSKTPGIFENVCFDVYGRGSENNLKIKYTFTEIDGEHTFSINNVTTSGDLDTTQCVDVKRNTRYKVTSHFMGNSTISERIIDITDSTIPVEDNQIVDEVFSFNSVGGNNTKGDPIVDFGWRLTEIGGNNTIDIKALDYVSDAKKENLYKNNQIIGKIKSNTDYEIISLKNGQVQNVSSSNDRGFTIGLIQRIVAEAKQKKPNNIGDSVEGKIIFLNENLKDGNTDNDDFMTEFTHGNVTSTSIESFFKDGDDGNKYLSVKGKGQVSIRFKFKRHDGDGDGRAANKITIASDSGDIEFPRNNDNEEYSRFGYFTGGNDYLITIEDQLHPWTIVDWHNEHYATSTADRRNNSFELRDDGSSSDIWLTITESYKLIYRYETSTQTVNPDPLSTIDTDPDAEYTPIYSEIPERVDEKIDIMTVRGSLVEWYKTSNISNWSSFMNDYGIFVKPKNSPNIGTHEWSGVITIQKAGTYTINYQADDFCEITINDNIILKSSSRSWENSSPDSSNVYLNSGINVIKFEMNNLNISSDWSKNPAGIAIRIYQNQTDVWTSKDVINSYDRNMTKLGFILEEVGGNDVITIRSTDYVTDGSDRQIYSKLKIDGGIKPNTDYKISVLLDDTKFGKRGISSDLLGFGLINKMKENATLSTETSGKIIYQNDDTVDDRNDDMQMMFRNGIVTSKINGVPGIYSPKALRKYEIIKVSGAEDLGYRVRENTDNSILEFDDYIDNGFDLNSSFEIVSTSPNTTAKLVRRIEQNKIFLYITGQPGDVTLKFQTFKDDASSKSASIAIKSLTIENVTWEKTWTQPDSVTHTFYENKNSLKLMVLGDKKPELIYRYDYEPKLIGYNEVKEIEIDGLEQGLLKERAFKASTNDGLTELQGEKSGQYIFADVVPSANQDNDMQVHANNGLFFQMNKTKITGLKEKSNKKDKRGTYELEYELIHDGVEFEGDNKINLGDKGIYKASKSSDAVDNPQLASYKKFTYKKSKTRLLSPFFAEGKNASGEELQGTNDSGKTWVMNWEKVLFPKKGKYTLELVCDDDVFIEIGRSGKSESSMMSVANIMGPKNKIKKKSFKINKSGKYDIKIGLKNANYSDSTFKTNPVTLFVRISTMFPIPTGETKSWAQNPMGVSAILIPPPCRRDSGGKGTVKEIRITDHGHGFPPGEGEGEGGGEEAGGIRLTDLIFDPENTVSNTCESILKILEDQEKEIYDESSLVTDLGNGYYRISSLDSGGNRVEEEHYCPTASIILQTETPVTAPPTLIKTTITPIDPIAITEIPKIIVKADTDSVPKIITRLATQQIPESQELLQITDLVGIKQTGFYNGKPYYGAVFYKDGVRYAGLYETVGELVQIYDTLEESITGKVTTRPSAIQRSGTDITSNDPLLNIPDTPENLL